LVSNFFADMAADDIDDVMLHPAQQASVRVVSGLIGELRQCRSLDDLDNLQRRLFQYLYEAEGHRSEVRRCQHRLRRGKTISFDLSKLPDGVNIHDSTTWQLEDRVAERVCRQLRAVGDAIAWRASGMDRRYIMAVSRNASPGPMASKSGLGYELGAAVEMRKRGNFGLLHDLTNCLRIGDVTEFSSGSKLLYEIKKDPHAKRSVQMRRMAAAVDAVMNGGELPGAPGSAFVQPASTCRTHMRSFQATIREAGQQGIAARPLPGQRVLAVVSCHALARLGSSSPTVDNLARKRAEALEQGGLNRQMHHLELCSVTRNRDFQPSVVPFALYPLSPDECALLICDYLFFTVVITAGSLVQALARHGIETQVPLPYTSARLTNTDAVLSMTKGTRRMTVTAGGLYELLMEFYEVDSWAAAMVEVFDNPNSPTHPIAAFHTTKVWR
jgi:hypothetical protein